MNAPVAADPPAGPASPDVAGVGAPRLPWILTVSAGVLASIGGFLLLDHREDLRHGAEFARAAGERVRVVRDEVRIDQALLGTVQGVHDGAARVERLTLATFLESLRASRPDLVLLAWAPRVSGEELGRFAATIAEDGPPDFAVRRRDAAGAWVPASPRAEHVPIAVVAPRELADPALGWDLAYEPAVRPALEAARDAGEVRATPPIPLGPGAPPGARALRVLLVQPVYVRGARRGSVAERRDAIAGYVIAFLDPTSLLRGALAPLAPDAVGVTLIDRTAGSGGAVLGSSGDPGVPSPSRLPPSESELVGTLHVWSSVDIGGRAWEILCVALPAFRATREPWLPWAVLAAGLLLTLLTGQALRGSLGREAAVRRAVAERTEALSRVNEDLRREIAVRRSTEASLAEQGERLEVTLRGLRDGVVTTDAQGRVTYLNPVAEALTAWDRETARGRPLQELFWFLDATTRATRNDLVDALLDPKGAPAFPESAVLVAIDGTERIVAPRSAVLKDRRGQPGGFVIVLRDVTEAWRSDQELREHDEVFRVISRELPDGLFLLATDDPEVPGRILHANEAAARMHGYEPADLVGRSIRDLEEPDGAEQGADRAERLARGETVACEGLHRRKDGSSFPVEVIAREVRWRGRRALLAMDRDITERRRAEAARRRLESQMQHAQRLESLGVLAGGIAHDFNNLLMGVLGNADLALMFLDEGSPAHARVEDVKRAGMRAADLTQQMLAYAGKGKFLVEVLDLNDLIRDMTKLLEVSISKRVKLELALEDGLAPIEADASQIRQVVMNLITNASEAIGEVPGTVTVRTRAAELDATWLAASYGGVGLPPGRFVLLEVADTGVGMDVETQRRIFEPFFTTKFTGRGLGLAALLGIVRGHRGAVEVTSAPGHGTKFVVALPPSASPLPPRPVRASGGAAVPHVGGTVLVVDDDASVREVVGHMLRTGGFEVIQAADGAEGIARFTQAAARVDAVLLDMTMPGLSGEETLRGIRAVRPDARVLLTSGFTEQDALARFRGLDLSGFVQKPFERDVLIARVRAVLESRARPPAAPTLPPNRVSWDLE